MATGAVDLIALQAIRAASELQTAARSLGDSRTLIDLARKVRFKPAPKAWVRNVSEVRRASSHFDAAAERAAEVLIKARLNALRAIDELNQPHERAALLRDLRELGPSLARPRQLADREVARIVSGWASSFGSDEERKMSRESGG